MKLDQILELIQEASEISSESLEDIKKQHGSKNISSQDLESCSNEYLSTIVASNRYLKINPKMEILCMQELAKRRSNGDNYPFEEKIEEYVKQFTPIETNVPEIFSMFSGLFGKSKI